MILLIRKTEKGWRCEKCSLDIVGASAMEDAEAHGIFFHRVLPDFLAMDRKGDFFDTSPVTPTMLRGVGAL